MKLTMCAKSNLGYEIYSTINEKSIFKPLDAELLCNHMKNILILYRFSTLKWYGGLKFASQGENDRMIFSNEYISETSVY